MRTDVLVPTAGRVIRVHDVVMRDGLQMEPTFAPTEEKVRLVDALAATGLSKIEVTSFVSARAIPALRDAEAVMQQIRRVEGVSYAALVANMRGAERALASWSCPPAKPTTWRTRA